MLRSPLCFLVLDFFSSLFASLIADLGWCFLWWGHYLADAFCFGHTGLSRFPPLIASIIFSWFWRVVPRPSQPWVIMPLTMPLSIPLMTRRAHVGFGSCDCFSCWLAVGVTLSHVSWMGSQAPSSFLSPPPPSPGALRSYQGLSIVRISLHGRVAAEYCDRSCCL